MKRVLIISPHFPPANAADMHRVRMSLPYFKEFGWEAEVVTSYTKYYGGNIDELLLKSLFNDLKIHYVKALDKKWTSKIGLGSLALRSLWYYKKEVNKILKNQKFDLIYFSTTEFPICILGAYWKKKFGIPYVIDMQDPWHSDYYKDKPKHERPAKYWFSYRLNKYLEPIAMKQVDGLIAVSESYINDLKQRYPILKDKPSEVITFGFSSIDFEIASSLKNSSQTTKPKSLKYIGVLGPMMNKALILLFKNISNVHYFNKNWELIFKGTSYAPSHLAKESTTIFAQKYNLTNVIEDTNRLGMYEVLKELQQADGLLIVGTDNPSYTASKLYPYLQSEKPILAILHPASSATTILNELSNAVIILLTDENNIVIDKLKQFERLIEDENYNVDRVQLERFSARNLTKLQTTLFDKIFN